MAIPPPHSLEALVEVDPSHGYNPVFEYPPLNKVLDVSSTSIRLYALRPIRYLTLHQENSSVVTLGDLGISQGT